MPLYNPAAAPYRETEGSAPGAVANTGFLYSKDVSGRTETFFIDDTGAEVQLTSAGNLNGAALADLTAYARLAGRAGGQVLQGGTAASELLSLESTSHATKGTIRVRDTLSPNADNTIDLGEATTRRFRRIYFRTIAEARLSSTSINWLAAQLDADSNQSFQITGRGVMDWGSGAAPPDVQLFRTAADVLALASGDAFRCQRYDMNQATAPATPGAGLQFLYSKTDNNLATKSPSGVEAVLTARAVYFVIQPEASALTATANKIGRIYMPYGGTIVSAHASVVTAPTTQAIIFDINLNGTTIWTTQGNRVQIAAGANTGTQSTFDTTTFASGDYFTIDIDQVGSGTAGAQAVVRLNVEQR